MEIIVRGKLPEEDEYEATCYRCRTVFRFQRVEARYVSDQREGDYLSIACPVCKAKNSVDVEKGRTWNG